MSHWFPIHNINLKITGSHFWYELCQRKTNSSTVEKLKITRNIVMRRTLLSDHRALLPQHSLNSGHDIVRLWRGRGL